MKKNTKRNIVAAAGAATILSLVFAGPSMAASHKAASSQSGSSTSTGSTWQAEQPKMHGAFAKLAATVTGVPTTVTTAQAASRGAYFTVFTLDSAATAVPTTKPTTGGINLDIHFGTLATGTLTGDIPLKGGANGSTTKLAIYPSTRSSQPGPLTRRALQP